MFDFFSLIDFYSSGIRQRTYKTALMNPIEIIKGETPDFDYVGFEQVVQVLAIFAVGALISTVIIFPGEILFSNLGTIMKKRK